jgi:hypothetical protein
MHHHLRTATLLVSRLALLLAFLALPGSATVGAKHCPGGTHECTIDLISFPIGAVANQTLRISIAVQPTGDRTTGDGTLARFELLNVAGRVLATSADVPVGPDHMVFWDILRNTLPDSGDAATGRLEVRARLIITLADGTSHAELPALLPSLELVDTPTGHTVAQTDWAFLLARADKDAASSFVLPSSGFGLARGQTLRANLVNASESPVRARFELVDADGRAHAVQTNIVIPSGTTRSIDVNRDALPITGEPGTGRTQVRYRFFAVVDRSSSQDDPSLLPSGQLLKTDTGQTQIALLVPAIQKIRDAK